MENLPIDLQESIISKKLARLDSAIAMIDSMNTVISRMLDDVCQDISELHTYISEGVK